MDFTDDTSRDYSKLDSFVIHVCLEGSYILNYGAEELPVNMGDCILIPASTGKIQLKTNKGFKILESYID